MNEKNSTETAQKKIRLNKLIAMSGFTSRRKADDLIKAGSVTVNGEVVSEMGVLVTPEVDKVTVAGVKIKGAQKKVYYILHKPKGYICANISHFDELLITDLLPKQKLSTVGRLDKHTTGLIIATNDGDFLHKLSHPSFECEKEYMVRINREMPNEQIEKLRNGIEIEVEQIQNKEKVVKKHFAKPKKVEVIKNEKHKCLLSITIGEGKKRQIRLMMKKLGYQFMDLKRIRIGSLKLAHLPSGEYRELTQQEIDSLINSTNA